MLFLLLGIGVVIVLVVIWYMGTVGVMRIRHRRALDQPDCNTRLVAFNNLRYFCRKPDIDTPLDQVLSPALVEFAELGEYHHGRQVAGDTVLIRWIPHSVRGTRAEPLENDTGYVGGFVAGTEEQRDHGHGDGVCEFLGEHEHFEEHFNGDEGEEEFEPANNLEHCVEASDFFLVPCEELSGEDIGPEDVVFAERNVEIDGIGVVALSCEHGHGVVEDVTSTLDTLVEPCGAMTLLVDVNGKGLASTVIYRIDECHVEFVGVLREMVST